MYGEDRYDNTSPHYGRRQCTGSLIALAIILPDGSLSVIKKKILFIAGPVMLITCKKCRYVISSEAECCPQCHHPDPAGRKQRQKRLYWLTALLIVITALAVLCFFGPQAPGK
jgi:hypothetical protein